MQATIIFLTFSSGREIVTLPSWADSLNISHRRLVRVLTSARHESALRRDSERPRGGCGQGQCASTSFRHHYRDRCFTLGLGSSACLDRAVQGGCGLRRRGLPNTSNWWVCNNLCKGQTGHLRMDNKTAHGWRSMLELPSPVYTLPSIPEIWGASSQILAADCCKSLWSILISPAGDALLTVLCLSASWVWYASWSWSLNIRGWDLLKVQLQEHTRYQGWVPVKYHCFKASFNTHLVGMEQRNKLHLPVRVEQMAQQGNVRLSSFWISIQSRAKSSFN